MGSTIKYPEPVALLTQACKRLGYRVTTIDKFSGYLVEVSNGSKKFLAGAGSLATYPLNSANAFLVARDKAHTYAVLRKYGFSVPRGEHFFLTEEWIDHRPPGRELDDAIFYAEKQGYPLVVKPNFGSFARGVNIVFDKDELIELLDTISEQTYLCVIQEYLKGREFRYFVIDGRVQFAYEKATPTVTGDGHRSIEKLLSKCPEKLSTRFIEYQLSESGLSRNSILSDGQTLTVSPIANVSAGGRITRFLEYLSEETEDWISSIAEAVQLRVFALDVIERGERGKIIDVNANPSLDSLYRYRRTDLILSVWKEILLKYFSD